MSFELAIWRAESPVTLEEASAALQSRSFGAGWDVAAFRSALLAQVPRELLEESSYGPSYAIVRTSLEHMDAVGGVAMELAYSQGLIWYDAHRHLVGNLAPQSAFPDLRLHTGDGLTLEHPDLNLVHEVLGRLSPESPFVALVVPGRHFLQTSEDAPGTYTLELRDSRQATMHTTVVNDLAALRRAFHAYATADSAALEGFDWHRA